MLPQLAIRLLGAFADGNISAADVQSFASAAYDDGWGRGDRLAQRLVAAGGGGTQTGNTMRDVLKAAEMAGITGDLASPYRCSTQGKDGAQISVDVFLPHEAIHHLVGQTRLAPWCLAADQVAAPDGVGKMLTDWTGHPDIHPFHIDPTTTIALGLHADGIQYTSTMRAGGARSMVVMSFNIISAKDHSDRSQRFLLAVIGKDRLCACGCSGFHTFQGVWKAPAPHIHCSFPTN